jgi:hypothetical protein
VSVGGSSVQETSPAREPGPVLATAEAQRRAGLLGTLRDALAERSIETVLVTRRRIVLRADMSGGPSGPTDPSLHIFGGAGVEIVRTDGTQFIFASGNAYPATNPRAAAVSVPEPPPDTDDEAPDTAT